MTIIRTGKKFSKPAMSRVINGDTELAEVTSEAPEKIRLDHLLSDKHPSYNRSTLQKFIKQGFVTVDGVIVTKPNHLTLPSAKITLNLPPENRELPQIPVIYEDDNVLVLNKPAGLLSMAKGEYCPEPTLEDYGLLVHRLDRDTSGVVILAKNPQTQKMLRRQFQDRKAHKTYYAVVEGHPKQSEALIDLPIERNFKRPNTFLITPNGKASQTYYKVIKQNATYSLLELKPTTGRTHQLRVHLQYLGTPILGDRIYNPDTHRSISQNMSQSASPNAEITSAKTPDLPARLYLHAHSLEITIPEGQRRTFTAPLPSEFDNVLR